MANVEVQRVGEHEFEATNGRGARVRIGRRDAADAFSPVELLLAAAAGCAVITAESLVTRRVDGGISARADDVRPGGSGDLTSVPVTLDYDVSVLDDEQRQALAAAVHRAVEKLCTVSRALHSPVDASLHLP
ncbi:OsmC family protein [Saccharothrix violaceirubra]|uniref:Putative OsmC-like protein n=1 Tax=Saccharothrix violaceirubra TaxID=413306 RepID=A0A7W7T7R0_9PSEU|nr:OsmC family protein [Saccharothrix violaceirubra]MBB4968114.1 putative OsmC-like protein [Saccharothrix violaceirubra]